MIYGCIHGRFQPFHNGHLEYAKAAFARCEHLIVGITQFAPDQHDNGSPEHRLSAENNPFTYWERHQIINNALWQEFEGGARFSIVPFPIHSPETIRYFVPHDCIMFTTVYDEWNEQKIVRLKEQSFEVQVLWRRSVKQFEGKSVRRAMREDWSQFERLVPQGAYEAVASLRERTVQASSLYDTE